jgi:hypothetical protein
MQTFHTSETSTKGQRNVHGIKGCKVSQLRNKRISYARSLSNGNGLEAPIVLKNGRVTSGPDLSVTVNGINFPNPFVIGRCVVCTYIRDLNFHLLLLTARGFPFTSGPPGTNYQVMKKVSDVFGLPPRC